MFKISPRYILRLTWIQYCLNKKINNTEIFFLILNRVDRYTSLAWSRTMSWNEPKVHQKPLLKRLGTLNLLSWEFNPHNGMELFLKAHSHTFLRDYWSIFINVLIWNYHMNQYVLKIIRLLQKLCHPIVPGCTVVPFLCRHAGLLSLAITMESNPL